LFAEVRAVTLEAVIKTEIHFAIAPNGIAKFGWEVFREPGENGVFAERVVSVLRNTLELTVNANDERLTCLHVQVGRYTPLTPTEQLPEPGMGLNGLHASDFSTPYTNQEQSSPKKTGRDGKKKCRPGPNNSGAAVIHTNFHN
jgi:hypothetical protein